MCLSRNANFLHGQGDEEFNPKNTFGIVAIRFESDIKIAVNDCLLMDTHSSDDSCCYPFDNRNVHRLKRIESVAPVRLSY